MPMPHFAILGIGPTEMVVIGVVVLILFGRRLPEVMRGLGTGVREFRNGLEGQSGGDHKAGEPPPLPPPAAPEEGKTKP